MTEWQNLYEPANVLLISLATFLIYLGCRFGHYLFNEGSFLQDIEKKKLESEVSYLTIGVAIAIPLVGSVALLILFFFLDKISIFIVIWVSFVSIMSISFLSFPLCEKIESKLGIEKEWDVKWIGPVTPAAIGSFILGIIVVVIWLVTRESALGPLTTDILAIALIITAISTIRLPNLKVAVVFLGLFFAYDIFWVFISPLFFRGKSVMVQVATNLPSLPLLILFPKFLADCSFPCEWTILGAGDIILPGIFLSFLYRFDFFNERTDKRHYFRYGLAGYVVGIFFAFLAVTITEKGQPALLYLVPCTLIPTFAIGYLQKEIPHLWKGKPYRNRNRHLQDEDLPSNQIEVEILEEDQDSEARLDLREEEENEVSSDRNLLE